MVLRVDVVAAALDAVYGGAPDHRVVALTPQGRQLTQPVVEELAGEERLTLLSARFEGFDERIVTELASDAVSIGPYVLSGGELPAMVVVDAVARLLPGALGHEESGLRRELLGRARPGVRVPALHSSCGLPGPGGPEVLLSGDHGRIDTWRRDQSRARSGKVDPVRSPYDILGVAPDASTEEIDRAYGDLARFHTFAAEDSGGGRPHGRDPRRLRDARRSGAPSRVRRRARRHRGRRQRRRCRAGRVAHASSRWAARRPKSSTRATRSTA